MVVTTGPFVTRTIMSKIHQNQRKDELNYSHARRLQELATPAQAIQAQRWAAFCSHTTREILFYMLDHEVE